MIVPAHLGDASENLHHSRMPPQHAALGLLQEERVAHSHDHHDEEA